MAVWYKVNFYATNEQDKKQVIHLHLTPNIWVSLSQHSQLLLSRSRFMSFRKKPFPDLLSPGAVAYSWGSGSRKLEDSCFRRQRDFYYCTAVSTAKTGSPSFCVYPPCLYICIAYWLLPYFVHDSYILYE